MNEKTKAFSDSQLVVPYWRKEVRAFADAMETKLRENDHKPGWKRDSPNALLSRLYDEVTELDSAVSRGDDGTMFSVLSEAADVANFCMMIADVFGALPPIGDAAPAPDVLPSVPVSDKQIIGDLTAAFTKGYHAGHHETVEGSFINVHLSDQRTYFEEAVRDILSEGELAGVSAIISTQPASVQGLSERFDAEWLAADESKQIDHKGVARYWFNRGAAPAAPDNEGSK